VIGVDIQAFMPDNAPTPYVRASFSLASEEDIDTALARLAALLREEAQGPV
jgi:kynurenine/2-aminoadipate aminotransferase